MNEDMKANYYAIIPAFIRYNKELKFAERLMYGEITALSNMQGYCYASNKYFAELYGVSQGTIFRWISHLAELNSIQVEIIRNEKKEIMERRLYVVDTPYTQNNQYPILKKSKENIINNNMLDSLFNYIINKEEQIPTEFENHKDKISDVLNKYEMVYTEKSLQYMQEANIQKIKIICY